MDHADKAHVDHPITRRPKKKETNAEAIRSFIIAILIALVFRSLAYEPFHIPSGSMLTTLYKGDYIFVSKLSYGYSRYSFPLGFDWFEGRKFFTAPERGDVVVFRKPTQPSIDYIKRVIGLPGDRIQVMGGLLYINGKAVEITRIGDVRVPDSNNNFSSVAQYEETLPNGRTHIILDAVKNGPADDTPEYTVPEKHYFMMGDNRDNSEDSRYMNAVGFVPEENLVGRAEIIAVSFNGEVPVWKAWRWPFAFRNDRWFVSLEK